MSKETKEKQPFVPRTPTDFQKLKLERLMQNPDKPVVIPESPREKKGFSVPEFVRNVMGSSAGAGSGEFHVYRHLRRKEYTRQKMIDEKGEKEKLDEDYRQKIEDNKRKMEEKTAKKRAKRLKWKEKMKIKAKSKAKSKQPDDGKAVSESSTEESEDEGESCEDHGDSQEKKSSDCEIQDGGSDTDGHSNLKEKGTDSEEKYDADDRSDDDGKQNSVSEVHKEESDIHVDQSKENSENSSVVDAEPHSLKDET